MLQTCRVSFNFINTKLIIHRTSVYHKRALIYRHYQSILGRCDIVMIIHSQSARYSPVGQIVIIHVHTGTDQEVCPCSNVHGLLQTLMYNNLILLKLG